MPLNKSAEYSKPITAKGRGKMIETATGKDRRCARCGVDEFRIDGFCSTECRDKAEYEEEIKDLQTQLISKKADIDRHHTLEDTQQAIKAIIIKDLQT